MRSTGKVRVVPSSGKKTKAVPSVLSNQENRLVGRMRKIATQTARGKIADEEPVPRALKKRVLPESSEEGKKTF